MSKVKIGLIGLGVVVGLAMTAVVGAYVTGAVEKPEIYVVVKGDTLGVIAKTHGVTVDELRSWNQIHGDLIEVGQVLVLWQSEEAPSVVAVKPKKLQLTGSISGGTGDRPSLRMPAPQRCLAGPSLDELTEDEEMMASSGLHSDDVSVAMGNFVHNVLPCISGTSAPVDVLELEITVACSGVVDSIEVASGGDWPDDVAECVAETLSYAPFPAHDLPDGDMFIYPLQFSPG